MKLLANVIIMFVTVCYFMLFITNEIRFFYPFLAVGVKMTTQFEFMKKYC